MNEPTIWAGFEIFADETLPPEHVKFLHGHEQASVFRLDSATETSTLVATWPEKVPDA